ncbi:hypothetical protein Q1695_001697 [Nippostrongylus brasiliensis]|nr:hypothetical protein Q1695_001697 [Nippostrongylus brasiliensis]
MYIQKSDLLNIRQSASKPSLLSSYWSIHVQVQNSDRLDMDVKSCSQSSLPDAFGIKSNHLRSTKSLSDLMAEESQVKTCLTWQDNELSTFVAEEQLRGSRPLAIACSPAPPR